MKSLLDLWKQSGGPKLSTTKQSFLAALQDDLAGKNGKTTLMSVSSAIDFTHKEDAEMFIQVCLHLSALGLIECKTHLEDGTEIDDAISSADADHMFASAIDRIEISATKALTDYLSHEDGASAPELEPETSASDESSPPKDSSDDSGSPDRSSAPVDEIQPATAGLEASIQKEPEIIDQELSDTEESIAEFDVQEPSTVVDKIDVPAVSLDHTMNADDSNRSDIDKPSATFSPPPLVLKRRLTFFVGAAISVAVVVGAIGIVTSVVTRTAKIEKQVKSPAEGLVVVSQDTLNRLKQELADSTAKVTHLESSLKNAYAVADGKIRGETNAAVSSSYKDGYARGKEDAMSVSRTTRERVERQSARSAVVTGSCDGYGRGNRFDEVVMQNRKVDVLFWLIDPSSQRIAGLVGVEESLLKLKDGAVTQVKCISGRADFFPTNSQSTDSASAK